nr:MULTISPECIES: universal stress protein [Kribbella]
MNDRPNIFVGIDPSWRNSGALDWALRESHLRGQPIRAVHVIEDKLPFGPESTAPGVERAAKRLVADIADYLAGHDETIGKQHRSPDRSAGGNARQGRGAARREHAGRQPDGQRAAGTPAARLDRPRRSAPRTMPRRRRP